MRHHLRTSILFLALMILPGLVTYDIRPPDLLASGGPTDDHGPMPDIRLTMRDATPEQSVRLAEALALFEEAGLELPGLEFSFPGEPGSCGDAHGRFSVSDDVMRVTVCSVDAEWVYVHELAHAWEYANVSDDQRRAFLDLRGLAEWRDRLAPWNERGVEWAAVVIQQGLTGLPLPPALSYEMVSRLEGFEILTGRVAPTLVAWVEAHEVPCGDRPTVASRSVADANGLTCESNRSVRVYYAPDAKNPHRTVPHYRPRRCQPLLSSPMGRG